MLGKLKVAATVVLCGSVHLTAAAEPPQVPQPQVPQQQVPQQQVPQPRDRKLTIEVSLLPDGSPDASPHYRVLSPNGGGIIGWSRLGIDLADGEKLGGPCEVVSATMRPIRDDFVQIPGKRRQVVGKADESIIRLREKTKPFRQWEVVLREYDDGVAFRYRFPEQAGWTS